jgi:hypothetical protein
LTLPTWKTDCGCVQEVGLNQKRDRFCEHKRPYVKVVEGQEEEPRARRSSLRPGKGFAVHASQRRKIKGLACVSCGADPYEGATIDPAHLIPRHWVSCEHPDGVIPLCRKCHDAYDVPSGGLDILAQLEERGYHKEMAHFISEHQVNPLTLLRYVTGCEYVPKSEAVAS